MPGENHHLVVGDFNIHDTLWSIPPFPWTSLNSERATEFKELIEQAPLTVHTPPGLVTRPLRQPRRNHGIGRSSREAEPAPQNLGTTLDLCLSSWDIGEQICHVRVVERLSGLSDHRPVETELTITLKPKETQPPPRGGPS